VCEVKVHVQQLRHEAIKGPRSRKFLSHSETASLSLRLIAMDINIP